MLGILPECAWLMTSMSAFPKANVSHMTEAQSGLGHGYENSDKLNVAIARESATI
jgi:hypothetical protein